MRTYEKIETIYNRDMTGTKKLIDGDYRNDTIKFLKDVQWEWSEKVDGTNVRILWDGHKVTFGGRTDKAQIPTDLVNKLNEYFGGEKNAQIFEQMFGEREVMLFGEGYGNKIQSAGRFYNPNGVDFILFDVLIMNNYQSRDNIEGIAKAFGIKVVPIVGKGTLDEAVAYIKKGPISKLVDPSMDESEMEGIVCRPEVELRDRAGNRLIVKIKYRDFKDVD